MLSTAAGDPRPLLSCMWRRAGLPGGNGARSPLCRAGPPLGRVCGFLQRTTACSFPLLLHPLPGVWALESGLLHGLQMGIFPGNRGVNGDNWGHASPISSSEAKAHSCPSKPEGKAGRSGLGPSASGHECGRAPQQTAPSALPPPVAPGTGTSGKNTVKCCVSLPFSLFPFKELIKMQTRSVVIWGFLLSSRLHVGLFQASPHAVVLTGLTSHLLRDVLGEEAAERDAPAGPAQLSGG